MDFSDGESCSVSIKPSDTGPGGDITFAPKSVHEFVLFVASGVGDLLKYRAFVVACFMRQFSVKCSGGRVWEGTPASRKPSLKYEKEYATDPDRTVPASRVSDHHPALLPERAAQAAIADFFRQTVCLRVPPVHAGNAVDSGRLAAGQPFDGTAAPARAAFGILPARLFLVPTDRLQGGMDAAGAVHGAGLRYAHHARHLSGLLAEAEGRHRTGQGPAQRNIGCAAAGGDETDLLEF